MTNLDKDPDTDPYPDPDRHQNLRRALAEVCTVPVFLVDFWSVSVVSMGLS